MKLIYPEFLKDNLRNVSLFYIRHQWWLEATMMGSLLVGMPVFYRALGAAPSATYISIPIEPDQVRWDDVSRLLVSLLIAASDPFLVQVIPDESLEALRQIVELVLPQMNLYQSYYEWVGLASRVYRAFWGPKDEAGEHVMFVLQNLGRSGFIQEEYIAAYSKAAMDLISVRY